MINQYNNIHQFKSTENLLHIGFGKSGSTLLQDKIFPLIGKYQDRNFSIWNNNINLMDRGICSSELLLSWDPEAWYESIKLIKEISNKNTHILIVIRNPENYLSSIYAHECMRELLKYKSLNNYFIKNNEYKFIKKKIMIKNENYFNIDKFSYLELFKLCKIHFTNFTIIKFEDFFDKNFFQYYFSLNKNEVNTIFNSITIQNVGITNFSARFTSIISVIYKIFHKITFKKNNFKYNKRYFNYLLTDKVENPNNTAITKLILKLIYEIRKLYIFFFKILFGTYPALYKYFVVSRLNLFPSSKYIIKFKNFNKLNIEYLTKEYNNLPKYFSKHIL